MLGGTLAILILIALGFLARALGLLRAGDERPLNAFVYFFALPAFLLLNLSRTSFTAESLRFMGAGLIPILVLLAAFLLIRKAVGREPFYLLTASTVFGSLAFFGVPYVEYVLGPGEPERLAALVITAVAPPTVVLVLTLLELHGLEGHSPGAAVRKVLLRLSRNPLIIAIALGVFLSLARVSLPKFLAQALSYLSTATAPVALFSLGVFLHRRNYRAIPAALGLGSLRLLLLPGITLLVALALGLPPLERQVLVFLHGTPIAVNMIVLSQRYRFQPELIGTVVLVSSLGSLLTLSLWRWILG